VLAVVAGGLRRWLEDRQGRLGAVRIKVPVSLHGVVEPGDDGAGAGNRDSFFCLDVPLAADPVDRLRAIRHATRVRKAGHDAQELDELMRRLGHAPQLRSFAQRVLTHPRSFALNVSNVPLNFGLTANPTLVPDVDRLADYMQADVTTMLARREYA
jgi:diacylglycerol O-acyltransferase / wax synthase